MMHLHVRMACSPPSVAECVAYAPLSARHSTGIRSFEPSGPLTRSRARRHQSRERTSPLAISFFAHVHYPVHPPCRFRLLLEGFRLVACQPVRAPREVAGR